MTHYQPKTQIIKIPEKIYPTGTPSLQQSWNNNEKHLQWTGFVFILLTDVKILPLS